MCTLYGIHKWELLAAIKKPVYPSRCLINKAPPITNTSCRSCGAVFDLGIYKGNYIAYKTCQCGYDGTNLMTLQKLQCFYTQEDTSIIINLVNLAKRKGLPNTNEYWINRGNTLEEAAKKVSSIQQKRSAKSPASQKGARGYSVRTIEYWIKKGYCHEMAVIKVKESQTQNGLIWYIKKYGEEKGQAKFNARVNKWNLQMAKLHRGVSQVATELFTAIDPLRIGKFGDEETTVRAKNKIYRVDYYRKESRKIIEFNGEYWHADSKKYLSSDLIKGKTAQQIWDNDVKKLDALRKNGFAVLVIKEADYYADKDKVINECREFLK